MAIICLVVITYYVNRLFLEINDRVYGKIVIDEPVLIELINSKPVQRLKGINQAGASKYAWRPSGSSQR